MELKDTIKGMTSDDYKERFKAEYFQLKIRIDKLDAFIGKIKTAQAEGTEEPKHDCPLNLLEEQLFYMKQYLNRLDDRTKFEDVDLSDAYEIQYKEGGESFARQEGGLTACYRELTEEEYKKLYNMPHGEVMNLIENSLDEAIFIGYGFYGAELREEDGKFYAVYKRGNSCD